jgi:hypothetical protein
VLGVGAALLDRFRADVDEAHRLANEAGVLAQGSQTVLPR